MNIFETLAISVILAAIKEAVKNPERAATLKRALIKVRDAINALYPGE